MDLREDASAGTGAFVTELSQTPPSFVTISSFRHSAFPEQTNTMNHANLFKTAFGVALALQVPALAGTTEAPAVEPAASNSGDWCTWLQNKPGTLYKNKENPYLQEFQLEGRFQYQAAHVDGSDINNNSYHENYDEYRRVRIGAKAKFLQYFGAKVSLNMVDDTRFSGGQLDWGYIDFDEAFLSFDLGKAIGENPFDSLTVNYGRQKFTMGHESHTSSTKLYTVERSAISNKIYGSYRPTGFSVDATKGDWSFAGAVYSSTVDGEDNEAFNWYQDSVIYYANAGYKVSDELTLGFDFTYNDANEESGQNSVMDYVWATSLNAQYDAGQWGVIGDLIYGDNGGQRLNHDPERSGNFYGVVVMPYYWLIKDKLQLVGQYYYQGSEKDEGVRANSRYDRANIPSTNDVNSGRGDSQNVFYGGLNYYLCGQNIKFQGGIQYQAMDTPGGTYDDVTYVIAFRSYF